MTRVSDFVEGGGDDGVERKPAPSHANEFRCWDAFDEEGTVETIAAFDAWSAAKRFTEKYDQAAGGEIAQGALRGGHKMRVHVRSFGGVVTMWDVWPEIRWYASAAGVVQGAAP